MTKPILKQSKTIRETQLLYQNDMITKTAQAHCKALIESGKPNKIEDYLN